MAGEGGFLSDRDILKYMKSGDIVIYPFLGPNEDGTGGRGFLAPSGYYVHFMEEVLVYNTKKNIIDPDDPEELFEEKHINSMNLAEHNYELLLKPGMSVIIATFEELWTSKRINGVLYPSLVSRMPNISVSPGELVPGWNFGKAGVFSLCLSNNGLYKTIRLKASYKKDNKIYYGHQIGRVKYELGSSEAKEGYDDSIFAYPSARRPQVPRSGDRFKILREKGIPIPMDAPPGSKLKTKTVESLDYFIHGKGRKRMKK